MNLQDFSGARRIPLVGRRSLLQEAEQRIQRGGVHLFYCEGGGGIGKTAFLETVLDQARRAARGGVSRVTVAEDLLDLYHTDVHTPEGLMRRVMHVLGDWTFVKTQSLLEALDQARAAGDSDAEHRRAREAEEAFFEEFSRLAEHGVVLALDTLEVLELDTDPFQAELGVSLDMPVLSTGQWLLDRFLPALDGSILLLLAGRPSSIERRLRDARERTPRLQLRHATLGALPRDEVREYIRTVARLEAEQGDTEAAARLWEFCETRSEVTHYLTGGRPILLSLVADLVARDWTLPSAFNRSLDELKQRDRKTWWPEIEWALVVRIQESLSPIGDTIRSLAWLRKGATPELLARVMDLKTWDGQWDTETASAHLVQAAHLSLVKVRPRDGRLFLHDEMYALLDKYVLRACSRQERDWVYSSIEQYYVRQTRELKSTLAQSPYLFSSIQPRLAQAYIEELHYRLCHDPQHGFAMYFWLAEEALGSRNAELDMLLRTELLRTVGWLKDNDLLNGLDEAEVELDLATRWGMRALLLSGNPEAALRLFDRVMATWSRDVERLALSRAHVAAYQALARIQRAGDLDWAEARALLGQVQSIADEVLAGPMQPPAPTGRRWRARVLKALVLNYQGFLDRQQGSYLEAVRHYQESAMLQRRLGMDSLAGTLTNLSYAMALTGQFRHARLLAEEAERSARTSSKEHVLALALNARALVEQYDDHPRNALRFAERAMEIVRGARDPRAQGLIRLSRARAYRYLWDSLTDDEKKRESGLLDEAIKDANQAVSLLRNVPSYQVEATLERGCIHRQVALELQRQGRPEEMVRSAARSRRDLERVATSGGPAGFLPQRALAWANLGWLYYYIGDMDRAGQCIRQGGDLVPVEYRFPAAGGPPPLVEQGRKPEACLPFWSTLGKIEMLSAYVALARSRGAPARTERDEHLKEAVRHISLSLAYDEHIADEYFDLARAEAGLHKHFLREGLAIGGLHHFATIAAAELGLDRPTRFQRFLTRIFGPAELWA